MQDQIHTCDFTNITYLRFYIILAKIEVILATYGIRFILAIILTIHTCENVYHTCENEMHTCDKWYCFHTCDLMISSYLRFCIILATIDSILAILNYTCDLLLTYLRINVSHLRFGEHTCVLKSYLRFPVPQTYLRFKNARTCEIIFASMVKSRKYGVIPCDGINIIDVDIPHLLQTRVEIQSIKTKFYVRTPIE